MAPFRSYHRLCFIIFHCRNAVTELGWLAKHFQVDDLCLHISVILDSNCDSQIEKRKKQSLHFLFCYDDWACVFYLAITGFIGKDVLIRSTENFRRNGQ